MASNDALTSRQRAIVQDLKERGFVSTTALAEKYQVSDMTIRRDARRLEQQGIARSVHGGLMLPHDTMHGVGFAARANNDSDAKHRIAAACVEIIGPHERVFIDAGTTAYSVARALPAAFAGTLITHSVPVAQIALQLPDATTISLGGQLLHDSQAFVGYLAIANLRELRAETAFIGIAGVDQNGLYIERNLELSTKRAIMAASDRVVLVAASSKMGRSDLVRLGDFGDIDVLVTDRLPPDSIAAALAEANVQVIVTDE
ncbi:DeoR/GlpR family DNA-binding transcription regulator [uncultured Microbacterium sp.]|uniref:DeoR/GlpR family DNA-binding transcription regulator n=1 Tax=uncultured Microbacterium sp. TaxID=191216 RepID=UPI0026181ADA|nr:DeoR/GlpR family DNA-binding transcription regulator [uncultured Microbacterium sp.]